MSFDIGSLLTLISKVLTPLLVKLLNVVTDIKSHPLWHSSQWSWKLTNCYCSASCKLYTWCLISFMMLPVPCTIWSSLSNSWASWVCEAASCRPGWPLTYNSQVWLFCLLGLCVVFHWNNCALQVKFDVNFSFLAISCTISLSLVQIYMRGMFPWHTVTTWRRCPSIFLFLHDLTILPFLVFLTLLHHIDAYRSGEWGDHVTLQAAADLVSSTCLFFFFFWLYS